MCSGSLGRRYKASGFKNSDVLRGATIYSKAERKLWNYPLEDSHTEGRGKEKMGRKN